MASPRRVHRFPRCRVVSPTPRNLLVWTIGAAIAFLLLIALTDMALCAIEEEIKPEMSCWKCVLDAVARAGQVQSFRSRFKGDEFVYLALNRTCPHCGRAWSDYKPYYWRWLRDPIRDHFGRLHF